MDKNNQDDRIIEEMLQEQRRGEEWERVETSNLKVAEVYA